MIISISNARLLKMLKMTWQIKWKRISLFQLTLTLLLSDPDVNQWSDMIGFLASQA